MEQGRSETVEQWSSGTVEHRYSLEQWSRGEVEQSMVELQGLILIQREELICYNLPGGLLYLCNGSIRTRE